MSGQSNGKASSVIAATLPPLSPEGMLSEYRRLSPADMNEQAAQFKRMPNSQQRELLFYMIAQATKGLQILNGMVDPKNISRATYHDMSPTKQ